VPRLLCLVLDRAPYGSLQPAEAIRHAGGALGKGWDVVLAFLGDSVYTALPGQSPPAGGWVSLSEALGDLLGTGDGRVTVWVDQDSLVSRGLTAGDLIPGARPAAAGDIAAAIVDSDQALLF
jgi:sulfur relay (sulfurtransferase) DsrF/TusC family protein